ncbi:MAG TPA: 16S rRNA (adenine(1518)-N(6)/adenine(1519)-N(6))-dimethyltransferase RsmA [Candidatus Cloacimonadota bacterium]|nr:16S rRNA (adenine(1518)-N(6)/adenine(1519)-N(6))-dimethyltransferase RsmA [Candidatus Cloacimonadota bacterium]HPS38237.1 16S rRNA (adenine(1518)-N(6)/adenine(1519)-N(6))-dimethyltransferase RsmA [Candidatus Cloacimonadota bacterium]
MKALKELGQNFLIDGSVASAIAAAGEIVPGEIVWEIGPGKGILSEAILRYAPTLTAFELDRRLELPLKEKFGQRLNLVRADVIRYDWSELIIAPDYRVKLIANIPYQITSPLLSKLEANREHFSRIVLMVQSEVADRLTASKGTKAYGLMTLRLQLYFNISILMRVPRELFDPVPGVDSAVIVMTPRQDSPVLRDPELFFQLIHHAFQHRRKTLRNNLLQILTKPQLVALEKQDKFDLTRRGETFSEAEFIRLCDLIASLRHVS